MALAFVGAAAAAPARPRLSRAATTSSSSAPSGSDRGSNTTEPVEGRAGDAPVGAGPLLLQLVGPDAVDDEVHRADSWWAAGSRAYRSAARVARSKPVHEDEDGAPVVVRRRPAAGSRLIVSSTSPSAGTRAVSRSSAGTRMGRGPGRPRHPR